MFFKRKVNLDCDVIPSIQHQYNLDISKSLIKNKTILDIGCWSGQYAKLAAKFAKKTFGIDPNEQAIVVAEYEASSAEFKVGSVLRIPFKDNFFDFVIFSEVLEHIPEGTEKKAIKEIKRVLKPNGHFLISTPSDNILSILLDPAFFLIKHRHYSKNQVLSFLKDNFQVEKAFYTRGIFNLITSNIELFSKHLFNKKFIPPNWLYRKLKDEYYHNGFASIYILAKPTNKNSL